VSRNFIGGIFGIGKHRVKLAPKRHSGYDEPMTTLLIATRNAHKVGEIQAILGPEFRCLTLKEFPDAPAVVEDADTFAGNATKKAVALAKWLVANPQSAIRNPQFVLADDSGLEVDALNGAPGVHSARFAALDKSENSHDADNNAKLLRLLEEVPLEKRTGRFHCVIALVAASPHPALRTPQLFDGTCEGRIQFSPSGNGGFGYDPLFVPDGFKESFAELGEEVKNQLSHRAKALAKLKMFFDSPR
jgi:XTP/dITP diphosphohydrolase